MAKPTAAERRWQHTMREAGHPLDMELMALVGRANMTLIEHRPYGKLKSYAAHALHVNGSDTGCITVTAKTRKRCRRVLAAALREWCEEKKR